jgi:hypothetical protein
MRPDSQNQRYSPGESSRDNADHTGATRHPLTSYRGVTGVLKREGRTQALIVFFRLGTCEEEDVTSMLRRL